jgi:hypothetical protein
MPLATLQLILADANMLHYLDLATLGGVLATLSVINIAELANVLYPNTYTSGIEPAECMFLIHVHKKGRDLLEWLMKNYTIKRVTDGAGGNEDGKLSLANLYLI